MSRTRNYASIVYPQSAPSGWLETLKNHHIPCFVSPLHTDDGKKEHFHILLKFDSVKTVAQARAVFETIGGVGCEPVKSLTSYARYLCHLDETDKERYSPSDVICLNGADYASMISVPDDRYSAISDMLDYIDAYHVTSFAELMRYARSNNREWFKVLCDSGTYVIKEYLKSVSWEVRSYGKKDD